jgi:hypothetical protein
VMRHMFQQHVPKRHVVYVCFAYIDYSKIFLFYGVRKFDSGSEKTKGVESFLARSFFGT